MFFCSVFWINVNCQGFEIKRTVAGIEVLENDKKVLFYRTAPISVNGEYEKAGYVHPLYGLNGEVLTEDFPGDHPYHHGIFWAWHQIKLHGKKIADGWVSENISWEVSEVNTRKSGKQAFIYSTVLWKYFDSTTGAIKSIVKEKTTISIHKATDRFRRVDFTIQLKPLVKNISLGGSEDIKGYGGFCMRLKLPGDISFSSRDGFIMPLETAIETAPWMKFSGSFDSVAKTKSSVIAMVRVDSVNQAQPWILRRISSMQNIVYPGNISRVLPEDGWNLQYSMIVSSDDLDNATIEKLLQKYKNQKL